MPKKITKKVGKNKKKSKVSGFKNSLKFGFKGVKNALGFTSKSPTETKLEDYIQRREIYLERDTKRLKDQKPKIIKFQEKLDSTKAKLKELTKNEKDKEEELDLIKSKIGAYPK